MERNDKNLCSHAHELHHLRWHHTKAASSPWHSLVTTGRVLSERCTGVLLYTHTQCSCACVSVLVTTGMPGATSKFEDAFFRLLWRDRERDRDREADGDRDRRRELRRC